MWTAEQGRRRPGPQREPYADRGVVTVGGAQAGVFLDGDRRWMPVLAPGGYCWKPASGDQVLVIKAGESREEACVAGRLLEETGLKPGEVRLHSAGSARLTLTNNGEVNVEGVLKLDGIPLRQVVQSIVSEMLGGG